MRIPLSRPDITQAEIDAVSAVMRGERLSLGPKLDQFESAISNYMGAPHAAAVSSGTAGLHLAVKAIAIGEGDEVIVPSFTFIAVANAIRYERAMPVFVDIDAQTLNLDPAAVEAAITARTRAILAVHTFGVPADIQKLFAVAKLHNLILLEDACEAIGAEWQGQKVGTFGAAGILGFYPNKQITTAEGGAVVTQDEKMAERIRSLRNQGRTPAGDWFDHIEIGYNYRLSELHATIGIEQLKRIESILARRAEIARGYAQRLASCTDVILPVQHLPNCRVSWFVFPIRLAQSFSRLQRDQIVQEMARRGIGCGRYFPPIHQQLPYRRKGLVLPVTEQVADRIIALPFFNALTDEQLDEICLALRDCVATAARQSFVSKAASLR
ncbi:MAG TPA: DegT/DnrJ/EryC1/StrS family aminotransferase [Candidatus Acidoferrum sp.]